MPTNTFTLEEAYGTPKKEEGFPTLVPAKRSAIPSTSGESFIPGFTEDNPLPKDSGLFDIIKGAASKYNVPEEIALAITQQESGYNPKVENEIGAKGLWQFIDATSSALGIDPFDPAQSSDAAMKEFAQQAEKKGVEWAIAHHFAGPDPKQHGPKTKAYVKGIMEKAERIAQALELDGPRTTLIGQEVPDEQNPQTLTKVKQGQIISVEEAYGPVGGAPIPATAALPFSQVGFSASDLGAATKRGIIDPIVNTGKGFFDAIADRINSPALEKVERTPEELEFAVEEELKKFAIGSSPFLDDPYEIERTKNILRKKLRYTKPMSSQMEAAKLTERRNTRELQQQVLAESIKDLPWWLQFLTTAQSPIKSILEDSGPTNVMRAVSQAPTEERIKYNKMREALQRREIIHSPNKYPAEVVAAAEAAETERASTQPKSITEKWNALMDTAVELKDTAVETPGYLLGNLFNAFWADPEMAATPIGFGLRPIQAARTARGLASGGKLIQLSDKILDGTALGAVANFGVDAADQLANRTHISSEELAFSAAAGGLFAGGFAGLGGILSRGARAKIRSLDDAKAKGELEAILHDSAAYELEVEAIARGEFRPEVTPELREQLKAMLGIKHEKHLTNWINKRRKEVQEGFTNQGDYETYLKIKAEERMNRAEAVASEREAAAAEQQAASEAGTAVDSAPQTPQGPSPGEIFRALRKPASQHTAEDKLILRSIPKAQRGEADVKTLARLAAAGGIAAGAYGLAPEDKKISTALLGGLAGLIIPAGGGRVLNRMRQSGAVSMDGTIPGLAELVKGGKLKPDVDAAKIRADEAKLLDRARQGDQGAFKEIYENNFPRISRYVRTYLREAGPKLGIDAEDVAQDVFIKFFNGLDQFKADSAVYTYLQSIARNEALETIRRSKTQRGGGEFKTTSMYNAGDDLGAGDAAAGHLVEGEKGLVKSGVENASADFESPEFNALYGEAQDRLLKAVQKIPEPQQSVFLLNRVEGMTAKEIGETLGMPLNTVLSHLKRANDSVLDAIGKDFDATKTVARADTQAIPTEGNLVKRGRGRPSLIEQSLQGTKVVDSSGRPLPVYHGTGKYPIEKFSLEHTGTNTGADDASTGIFFADDPEFAEAFASFANRQDGNKSGVHQVYLDIKNPVEIDASKLPQVGIANSIKELIEKAKADGHDGAIIKNHHYQEGFQQTEYVAFSPDQIVRKVNNKYQRGEVDPRLLKLGAVAALGAGAYAFLESENQKLAATIGALGGLALLSKGRGGESLGKGLVRTIDKGLGVTSTRLMNISRPLWWRTIEHYRAVLRDTHKYMKDADPFLVSLEHLPKDQKDFVTRAILTGNPGVATRMIEAIDVPELAAGWKKVRTVLDSLGDQLVHLKRFKNKEVDYFPRIVVDYPGLLKALGNEKGDFLNKIVDDANKKAIRARGTELTELERSLVINKALMSEPKLGGQPGFAKERSVKEITPELQKFYATPTESLHSYIRSAVEDIERAKFFGKDLEVVQKAGKEYTNVDASVGKMVDTLLRTGKINEQQATDVSSMLKSLFLNGERVPNEIIQKAKNLSYAGLLGNPVSATSQLGDAIIQTYIQGIRPTISSVVRSMTGRKFVSMKEFGLADHLAEEFVNTETTAKFLRKTFKLGLFAQLDAFGKNVGLNAAISNFGRMVKSEGGLQKLQSKYGDVLQPQEFQHLVKDLQKGEVTDLVRSVAFAELSRTQPITRLEMPQVYLDNPNGRLLYQFKTFMLKQMDVVRRDAYNEIRKGNVARGIKNLVGFTTTLGIAGATTSQIQNWLRGRDKEFELSDIPMNMLKTFGMSEYIIDHALGVSKEDAEQRRMEGDTGARTQKAEPLQTLAGIATPPFKMFDEIVTADPNALRYIPVIGPFLLEQYKKRKAEEAGL